MSGIPEKIQGKHLIFDMITRLQGSQRDKFFTIYDTGQELSATDKNSTDIKATFGCFFIHQGWPQ